MAATIVTGLLYAYSCSVMPGLRRTDDRTFVEAMQRINVAILNGWFALSFAGAVVLTTVAAILHLRGDGRPLLPWIAAALILYIAALVITGRVHVPLNNALVAAGDPRQITDLAAVRQRFEDTWVRWNIVRSVVATAAFGCLTWALVLHGRATATAG